MNIDYDKVANTDNGCIKELRTTLCFNCNYKTGYLISLVLHTIRSSFTYAQSAEFISNLPNSLKLIYIKDWKMNKKVIRLRNLNELVMTTIIKDTKGLLNDLTARDQILITLKILDKHIHLSTCELLDRALRIELKEALSQGNFKTRNNDPSRTFLSRGKS